MSKKRYELRPKKYLTGTGGRGGSVKRDGFVVYDRLTKQVAKGTTGEGGRPGAYATWSEADKVRARLEKAHQEALRKAAERKRERGE